MSTVIEAAHQSSALSTTLAKRVVGPRDTLKRQCVLGNRVCDALGVYEVGVVGQIVNVITGLVVAWVKGLAGFTAEKGGLLLRLDFLSTSEETAGWDTVLEESSVVG